MDSDIQSWIIPVALKELSCTYEIFEHEYRPGSKLEHNGRSCSRDTVTVQLTERRHIQIIDFNGRRRHPLDVTVSDGNIKIRATFSEECTKDFARCHDRKFTDRTVGGIICIEGYKLVFKPESNPLKTLTLEVSQFSLVGSEGSSPFGQPLNIEANSDLRPAMAKLQRLMRGKVDQSSLEMYEGPPIQSQFNAFTASRQSLSPTPNAVGAFATQVLPGEYVRQGATGLDKYRQLPPKYQKTVSILQNEAPRKDRRADDDEGGLSRLFEGGRNRPGPRDSSALRSSDEEQIQGGKSTPDETTNKTSGGVSFTTSSRDRPRQANFAASSGEDSRNRNDQDGAGLKNPRASKLPGLSVTASDDTDALLQVFHFDDASDDDPFRGLKRVPRSYVRVHEKQRAILERDNSWFRSGYNDGSSYASNVPSDVLNGLAAFASRNATQTADRGHLNASSDDLDEIQEDHKQFRVDSELEDISRSPSSVELDVPRASQMRTAQPTDEANAGTTNEGSGPGSIISYPQEVRADNLDRIGNEENGDTDEASRISWSQSPDSGRRRDERAPPSSTSKVVLSSPRRVEMDVDGPDLPRIRVGKSPISTPGLADAFKLGITLPPSSTDSEAELEIEMAHAIDEPVEEECNDHVEELNIQVEQTPFSDARKFAKPTGPRDGTRSKKRGLEDISSDSVIPASTSDAAPRGYRQSLSNSEFNTQSTIDSKEMDGTEPQVLTTQVSNGNLTAFDKDSVPGHVCLNGPGTSQSSNASPIRSTYDPQSSSSGPHMATPIVYQIPDRPTSLLNSPQSSLNKLKKTIDKQLIPRFSQEDYAINPNHADEATSKSRRDFTTQLATVTQASDVTSIDLQQERGPASPPMSQAHVDSTERDEVQAIQPSNSTDEQPDHDSLPAGDVIELPHHQTALDKFLAAYPSYSGNEAQFINGLVYIEWLVNDRGKDFLRKSAWDDLLRVLADDYMGYATQSDINGRKMVGLEFYIDLDQDPVFKQQVITPSTLKDAISSFEPEKIDAVRRVYNLPRASKRSTPDQPRASTAENAVRAVATPPFPSREEAPDPSLHAKNTTSKRLPHATELGHEVNYESDHVTAHPKDSPVRPVPNITDGRKGKPKSFETHSQFKAEQAPRSRNTYDVVVESIEASEAKRAKSSRRSLPWQMQEVTGLAMETRSGPSSPRTFGSLSGMMSISPNLRIQKEQEKPSAIDAEPDAAGDEDDPLASPLPRVPKVAPRKTQSLPNPPAKKKKLRQIGLDHVSGEELAFLQDFARRRMLNEAKGEKKRKE